MINVSVKWGHTVDRAFTLSSTESLLNLIEYMINKSCQEFIPFCYLGRIFQFVYMGLALVSLNLRVSPSKVKEQSKLGILRLCGRSLLFTSSSVAIRSWRTLWCCHISATNNWTLIIIIGRSHRWSICLKKSIWVQYWWVLLNTSLHRWALRLLIELRVLNGVSSTFA